MVPPPDWWMERIGPSPGLVDGVLTPFSDVVVGAPGGTGRLGDSVRLVLPNLGLVRPLGLNQEEIRSRRRRGGINCIPSKVSTY